MALNLTGMTQPKNKAYGPITGGNSAPASVPGSSGGGVGPGGSSVGTGGTLGLRTNLYDAYGNPLQNNRVDQYGNGIGGSSSTTKKGQWSTDTTNNQYDAWGRLTNQDTVSRPNESQAEARQAYNADADRVMRQRMMGQAMSGLSSFGGQAGTAQAAALPPRESMGTAVTIPDTSAAQNTAFGNAKAKAGSMGRAAMDSLRGDLADRGLLGGGTEARGLVDRLAAATNPLSDLNVAQQSENVNIIQHNQDLANSNTQHQFSGNIAQRGQDIGVGQANADRDLRAQEQKYQLLQKALSGLQMSY